METTRSPFPPSRDSQFAATGAPFGATAAPYGATVAPFTGTSAPFMGTQAPFGGPGGPGGRPPGGSDDFSFKELMEMISHSLLVIRAKWYWGLLGAAVVGGLVGFYLFSKPVEFDAQTDILAESTLDQVIGTQADSATTTDQTRENELRNHLSMMTSRKFRSKLAASFTPVEKEQIAGPYLKPGMTANEEFFQSFFDSNISIERERGREYYAITVKHMVPEVAIMVADRMAAEYLDYVQQEFKEANMVGYKVLEKQAEIMRADIAKIETASIDYQKKNGIISRADNQSILNERLKRLDASLTDVRVTRVGLETRSRQAHLDRQKSEYPWDNSYLALYANNPDLHKELDDATAQRAVLATRYGPNHPKMIDINSQIAGIQSGIRHNFDVAVGDLDSQLEVAVDTERQLKREFDSAFESSMDVEKLASNYEILSAGVDSKKVTLEDLEKKIGEASISSQLPANFMQIVDPAYLVKHHIPKRAIFGVLTAFLAFVAFLACPLLASAMDERVSGTSDVEKELGVLMVGAIPALKFRPEDRAHVVRNKVDLVTTEAFVGIAGQLEIGSATQRYPKVIVVTSTLPGEGKSLIASNIASTYKQLGKRTILIDLDLRRPVQHSLHSMQNEQGFLLWARSGFPIENIFDPAGPLGIRTLVDGTDIVPSGGIESQPSQFLISDAMERLIGTLKGAYDVVILDTPPAGVFQDALMVSRLSTDRVIVAREGIAPVVQVKSVIEDFNKAGHSFSGVVLNGFQPRTANKKLAYGYKAAAKGYQYGEKAPAAPRKKTRVAKELKADPVKAA
ncbi:MAG TPA: polysaccharide biosynthesis tyrosine autokinase [Opitutaceae bacterium]|nr:polysaccharide biosynthesis tyrosine autokinase [Opitutaceae bacterium]